MPYIEIGPVPGEENCAQVGSPHYTEASLRECEVFRRMLCRLFPVPEGLPVAYVGRTHPHDFGNYREVSIRYDEANGQAVEFAYEVERSVPAEWDSIARHELAWYERKRAYAQAVQERRLRPEEVPAHYGSVAPPQRALGVQLPGTAGELPVMKRWQSGHNGSQGTGPQRHSHWLALHPHCVWHEDYRLSQPSDVAEARRSYREDHGIARLPKGTRFYPATAR